MGIHAPTLHGKGHLDSDSQLSFFSRAQPCHSCWGKVGVEEPFPRLKAHFSPHPVQFVAATLSPLPSRSSLGHELGQGRGAPGAASGAEGAAAPSPSGFSTADSGWPCPARGRRRAPRRPGPGQGWARPGGHLFPGWHSPRPAKPAVPEVWMGRCSSGR